MTSNIRRPNKLYLHDLSLPSEQALRVLNLGTSCDRHDADPFLVQFGGRGGWLVLFLFLDGFCLVLEPLTDLISARHKERMQ
jgi:hypothetical protein